MASANSTDKLIIFKGDDTGGVFGRRLAFTIEAGDGVDLSGCCAEWIFDGIVKTFAAPLIPGEVREVFYSHNETRCMALGVRYGTFRIIDAAGKVRTLTNTKPVEVTNNADRCYPGASDASFVVHGIGDMKHSEFADLEEKEGMTLNEVGGMVNTLIRKLKGTVSAFAALLAFGAFADGAITPDTDFGDISPTAKLKAVVEASGAISGIDTNAVERIANAAVVTNALTVATTNRVALLESSKADKSALAAHVANTDNPHVVTAAQIGAVPFVEDSDGNKTAVTIGSRMSNEPVGDGSLVHGYSGIAPGKYSHAEGWSTVAAGGYSHSEGEGTVAIGNYSHAEGTGAYATGNYSHAEGTGAYATGDYSHAEGNSTHANGPYAHTEGANTTANGTGSHSEGSGTTANAPYSHASGVLSSTKEDDKYAFAWNGDRTKEYKSHGEGTFNINPIAGLDGLWIGEKKFSEILSDKADKAIPSAADNFAALTPDGNLADSGKKPSDFIPNYNGQVYWLGNTIMIPAGFEQTSDYGIRSTGYGGFMSVGADYVILDAGTGIGNHSLTNKADRSMISATNPTFSNAVLAVGLNIDTNSVAVLNDIAATFGGFPIEGTATTVGGLLAALAAAAAWLKKNKVQTLKLEDGSVETSADGGVAKLDDFFTESNSLLNGRLAYSRNATGLKDRAFNTLSFDGTEYNLSTALAAVTPTASGQPRDLLIVATATAATTISFTAGTIKGDKPTIDGSGTWLITLTEYASGVWYCRQIKMEDAA